MPSSEPGSLGDYITRKRTEAGLSMRQLAAKTGLAVSHVQRLENGSIRTRPAAVHLQKIAETLGLDPTDILAFIGVKPTVPEPRDYFRLKYGLSESDAQAAIELLEQRFGDQRNTNNKEVNP